MFQRVLHEEFIGIRVVNLDQVYYMNICTGVNDLFSKFPRYLQIKRIQRVSEEATAVEYRYSLYLCYGGIYEWLSF